MNKNSYLLPTVGSSISLMSIVSLLLGATSNPVQAATVSFSDPSPNGISYEWDVEMGNADAATFTRHVGAKSWNEPLNLVGLKGWTHTSNWVALNLTKASNLTVKIDRAADVPINTTTTAENNLYPAFSLFSGWQNSGNEEHAYNNVGNSDWADEINYLGHAANESGFSSVFKTFTLPAGRYSLAIGGDPLDPNQTGRHDYTATLTTTPVPEPSTQGVIGAATSLVLLSSLRRQLSNK